MRTTLDIDDDVLAAARERARRERRSLGATVSELARAGLRGPSPDVAGGLPAREPKTRYGIRPLPSRGGIVTDELVDRLRGEDAY